MLPSEPRRRRSDARRAGPVAFGPSPGPLGPPDPDGVMRSLELAYGALRRARRPMTFAAIELARPSGEAELRLLAGIVRAEVRDSDGLWRDGPLGLVLLLTDADGPSSEVPLARIRAALGEEDVGEVMIGRASPAPGLPLEELVLLMREDVRSIVGEGR